MSKWLKGLDEPIISPNGKQIAEITIKSELIESVFMAESETPKDTLRKTQKIIPMLQAAKNAVEFEDADFELVKKSVETNPKKLFDGVLGQILVKFEAEIKEAK